MRRRRSAAAAAPGGGAKHAPAASNCCWSRTTSAAASSRRFLSSATSRSHASSSCCRSRAVAAAVPAHELAPRGDEAEAALDEDAKLAQRVAERREPRRAVGGRRTRHQQLRARLERQPSIERAVQHVGGGRRVRARRRQGFVPQRRAVGGLSW